MKRIILPILMIGFFLALLIIGIDTATGLHIGLTPEEVDRIMATPEYQQELARRTR